MVGVDFITIYYSNKTELTDTANVYKVKNYNFAPSIFYRKMLPNQVIVTVSAGRSFINNTQKFDAYVTGTTNRIDDQETLTGKIKYAKIGIGKQMEKDRILFSTSVFLSLTSSSNNIKKRKRLIYDTLGQSIIYTLTEKEEYPSSLTTGLFFVPSIQYKILKGLHVGLNLNVGINYIDYTGANIRIRNNRDEVAQTDFDVIQTKNYSNYYELRTTIFPSINLAYRF
jgi:hypothetical protein